MAASILLEIHQKSRATPTYWKTAMLILMNEVNHAGAIVGEEERVISGAENVSRPPVHFSTLNEPGDEVLRRIRVCS